MRAMILAAGRGRRLGALTENKPKPMVPLAGRPLIAYTLESLRDAGIRSCVINLNYLGSQISDYVGAGEKWAMRVNYSREGQDLDTGGGLRQALPLLGGRARFLLVNADLLHRVNLRSLILRAMRTGSLAHLVVKRAARGEGDFSLRRARVLVGRDYTFCGISIISPYLFNQVRRRSFPLTDLLHQAIRTGAVSGEVYRGLFMDLGTQEQLAAAEDQVINNSFL